MARTTRPAGREREACGSFTERHHEIALVRIDGGSMRMLGPRAGTQLAYVVSGAGSVETHKLREQTAFEVTAGSAAQVLATSELLLIVIGLPIFVATKQPSSV